MSDNMKIYEAVREVPKNAKRDIQAGRLKGKTDINPMWRIKKLTEVFGPCGTGWYVQVADKRILDGHDGIRVATVDLNLFYRTESGEWSAPVFGTGGNTLVDKESKGLYTSDEAFKMAYTDALSVCCKMLGVGADVYWEADKTKYTPREEPRQPAQKIMCQQCGQEITAKRVNGEDFTPGRIATLTAKKYGKCLCWSCSKKQAEIEKLEQARLDGEVPPWEAR